MDIWSTNSTMFTPTECLKGLWFKTRGQQFAYLSEFRLSILKRLKYSFIVFSFSHMLHSVRIVKCRTSRV